MRWMFSLSLLFIALFSLYQYKNPAIAKKWNPFVKYFPVFFEEDFVKYNAVKVIFLISVFWFYFMFISPPGYF